MTLVERFIDVVGLERFDNYIQDYGPPIGLSIASARPERVQAIVTQSGNAYLDGSGEHRPGPARLDTLGFERPGNRDVQVGLFYDYRLNLDKYPAFQQ